MASCPRIFIDGPQPAHDDHWGRIDERVHQQAAVVVVVPPHHHPSDVWTVGATTASHKFVRQTPLPMDNEVPRGAGNGGGGGGGDHHDSPPLLVAPPLPPPPPRADTTVASAAAGGGFTLVGFRGAVRLLEGPMDDNDGMRQEGRRPVGTIHHLFVKCHDAVQKGDDTQSFPQFVDLLGNHHPQQNDSDGDGDRSGLVIRQLSIVVDWRRLPRDDVDRLFRTVLPHHPALTYVGISLSGLPSSCWRSLTESLPMNSGDDSGAVAPLSGLGLLGESIHQEPIDDHLDAIVEMLTRNVALSSLRVDAPLTANQGKLLCQALPHNTNLVALSIHVTQVLPDTLEGVAHSSSLQQVEVRGAFGDDENHDTAVAASASSLAKTL